MVHNFCDIRIGYLIVFCVLMGCASSSRTVSGPVLNTAFKRTAYPHPQDHVHHAYRKAVEEMGLKVVAVTPERIEAVLEDPDLPTRVLIEFGPSDKLVTDVLATSHYEIRGSRFIHYPYELSYKAFQHMDRSFGFAHGYPQAIYSRNGTGCRISTAHTGPATAPILIGGLEGLARRMSYTPEARAAGVEGRIYATAIIDESGDVACIEIVAGLPGGLNERAIEALFQSRFQPGVHEGRPTAMRISLPLNFRLGRR